MKLSRASEDYLEAVLRLHEKKDMVRSVDIAAALNVTKPSVSYSTKRLRESGHIIMAPDGRITLTSPGLSVAKKIRNRHEVIKAALIKLNVNEADAEADACRMEHEMSEATFKCIKEHFRK